MNPVVLEYCEDEYELVHKIILIEGLKVEMHSG